MIRLNMKSCYDWLKNYEIFIKSRNGLTANVNQVGSHEVLDRDNFLPLCRIKNPFEIVIKDKNNIVQKNFEILISKILDFTDFRNFKNF